MQKNCKKMQIYLHISKKSSIFAEYFNSGIHNNQNQTRVMKKVCVFKAWGGNCWFRVLAIKKRPELPVVYRVMVNRCLVGGVSEFDVERTAIDKAVALAKLDAMLDKEEGWA